jgi:hypothetical protein
VDRILARLSNIGERFILSTARQHERKKTVTNKMKSRFRMSFYQTSYTYYRYTYRALRLHITRIFLNKKNTLYRIIVRRTVL